MIKKREKDLLGWFVNPSINEIKAYTNDSKISKALRGKGRVRK